MPGNVSDDESYEQVDSIRAKENSSTLFHYCAQLYLRKRLNQVHEEMYGSKSTFVVVMIERHVLTV